MTLPLTLPARSRGYPRIWRTIQNIWQILASEKARALIDTGPLVSFLAAGLKHYSWACDQGRFRKQRLAGELLKREGREADPLFELLERGVIRIALNVQDERADLRALMHQYRNRPMSLADACLVRLSELHTEAEVFTLDSDFRNYRRHGNKVIPVLTPEEIVG